MVFFFHTSLFKLQLSLRLTFSFLQEASCAYVIVIMAVFWVTEALPISVTALLPVFKFPLAGVLSASDVGKVFFNVSQNFELPFILRPKYLTGS